MNNFGILLVVMCGIISFAWISIGTFNLNMSVTPESVKQALSMTFQGLDLFNMTAAFFCGMYIQYKEFKS